MKTFVLRYVLTNYTKSKTRKTSLLEIEVREKGSANRTMISTGILLTTSQFSDKNGFTCKNHPNAISITTKARGMFNKIESFTLSPNCRTLQDVKDFVKGKKKSTIVTDYIFDSFSSGLTMAQYKSRRVLRNDLIKYGKITEFGLISERDIEMFADWLKQSGNVQPTIFKKLTVFRMYCEQAKKEGIIDNNPFDFYKIERGKSKAPTFLTREEVTLIEELQLPSKHLERARDLFLFQCYTGLAYSDMQKFSRNEVSIIDGEKTIRSSRVKTDVSFVLLFLPQAERIAEKYEYQLPKISNARYNDYIKIVAYRAGIDKIVTSHVARHTFAVWMINNDVPIESVCKALGHTNIKQTQHYARLLAKKVINDMQRLKSM